tara:strand:+ start:3969 stop:4607 length:639 start_codon:yes stop_codon:yes gene_type:complete
MQFKQWLKLMMEQRGLNSATLADAIDENQPTIYRIITGETKNPRLQIVKKLEYFFKADYNKSMTNQNTDSDTIDINKYQAVIGSKGDGMLRRGNAGEITRLEVTKLWISKNVPENSGEHNLAVATGFGDSMCGMFNSGDPLLVDTGVTDIEYDGVYLFRVGVEGFIKTLQRIPGEGIRVISENKKYESWTIKDTMDFEVLARVLKVWASNTF